jgi:hypothetical protein
MKETDTLERFAGAARDAGIDFGDYVRALAEGGPEAQRMKERLEEMTGAYAGFATIAGEGAAAHDLINRLGDQGKAAAGAAIEYQALESATRELDQATAPLSEVVEAAGEALEGFVDPLAVYTGALAEKEAQERETAQATADATKDQKDSWEDYVQEAKVSISEYNAALLEQVTAQEEWAANMGTLAKRGVEEGVLEELARMGPEGAPLVAALSSSSDAELAKTVALFKRRAAASVDGFADNVRAGKPKVSTAAQEIREDMKARLSPDIKVPVKPQAPSAGSLAGTRSQIKSGIGTITVPVMLQKVPQSIWSTQRSVP